MIPSRSALLCLVVPALAFSLSLALVSSPAHADCPASFIFLGSHTDTTWSTAAVRETTVTSGGACRMGHAAYDLRAGTLEVEWTPQIGGDLATCGTADEYVVAGLAPGTDLTCVATLEVHATVDNACSSSGCGNLLRARLREGIASPGEFFRDVGGTGAGSADGTVAVPLVLRAGETFRLEAMISSNFLTATGCPSFVRFAGTLRFSGLPPGALITSCHGYVGPVVPVHTASWGRLKATYR